MKFRPHLTTGTLTAQTSEEFQQKLFFVQVCNKYKDVPEEVQEFIPVLNTWLHAASCQQKQSVRRYVCVCVCARMHLQAIWARVANVGTRIIFH